MTRIYHNSNTFCDNSDQTQSQLFPNTTPLVCTKHKNLTTPFTTCWLEADSQLILDAPFQLHLQNLCKSKVFTVIFFLSFTFNTIIVCFVLFLFFIFYFILPKAFLKNWRASVFCSPDLVDTLDASNSISDQSFNSFRLGPTFVELKPFQG